MDVDTQTSMGEKITVTQTKRLFYCGPAPLSNNINVMRDCILPSAFRAFGRPRFSPENRLNVVFVDEDNVGEGAVDEGGPTREFLRLLMLELKNSQYFCGDEEFRNLALVSRGMKYILTN